MSEFLSYAFDQPIVVVLITDHGESEYCVRTKYWTYIVSKSLFADWSLRKLIEKEVERGNG